MGEHDPLCPSPILDRCDCTLIATIRDDERNRLGLVATLTDSIGEYATATIHFRGREVYRMVQLGALTDHAPGCTGCGCGDWEDMP
jgi:hypothetical protein